MILPEDENFLLIFHREAPLDNSVDFMKVTVVALIFYCLDYKFKFSMGVKLPSEGH